MSKLLFQDTQTGMKLYENDIKVEACLEQGFTNAATARKVGLSRTQVSNIRQKLQKYRADNPRLLKKGSKAAEKILDDFLAEKDTVRASDAARIYETQQRVLTAEDSNKVVTNNFTIVNLSLISPTQHIDIPSIDNNVSEDNSLITLDNDSPTND